jgi:hypothetical protein
MELISDYPELRGVFVSDLAMANGAAQALAATSSALMPTRLLLKCCGTGRSLRSLYKTRSGWVVKPDGARVFEERMRANRCRHRRQPHHKGQHELPTIEGTSWPEDQLPRHCRPPARATTPASLGEQTNATKLIVRRSSPPERSII